MQVIQDFFNIKLTKIKNHVTKEMEIFYNKKKESLIAFMNMEQKKIIKILKLLRTLMIK